MKNILVTGGAGFIGSNFCHYMLDKHPEYSITVLDALTYAGNLDNIADLQDIPRFKFVHGDIRDKSLVDELAEDADAIVNFAAETHVDRSITDPGSFVLTDVYGVFVLLDACKRFGIERFVHISTDEVYGSIQDGSFKEGDALEPSSPYSASKAGGELLARSYFVTYGLPVLISRGSNNFGPYQYPEKLIPLFITNALEDKPLPVYGDGRQVRDWIYVLDHCEAIDLILHKGEAGTAYNVGGGNERTNLEVTRLVLGILGKPESLINFVADRPGHDRRYSLDCTRIRELGWSPRYRFEEALKYTVEWYVQNEAWWRKIKEHQAEYREFTRKWYEER
ncbi:MAG TPA: dTDP-glucose 4,6-dehydratase [Armatimonadota bacterium]|nr:dTDP-glucose 4,6-dehydratase [Armatimonadota bacterium]